MLGIWLGYAFGLVIWCLLSLGYWMFGDWDEQMTKLKKYYDFIQSQNQQKKVLSSGSLFESVVMFLFFFLFFSFFFGFFMCVSIRLTQ